MNQFDTPAEYAANLMRTHNGDALAAIEHVKTMHGMGGKFWRDTVALLEALPPAGDALTFRVMLNNVSATVTAHGEIAATIQARPETAFAGNAADTVAYLESLGIGRSVEVRRYRANGEWCGTRSCMNKPALWADILAAA